MDVHVDAPRTLVLALGNPLMGDDAFGARVLERLPPRGGVEVRDAHTDLLGRIDDFIACDLVILVDAVVGVGRPGEVKVFDEAAFSCWDAPSPSVHQVSPVAAIRLFRALHPGAATRIVLVALCIPRLDRASAFADDAAIETAVELVMTTGSAPRTTGPT